MTRKKTQLNLIFSDDDLSMLEAITKLNCAGVTFTRTSKHQIKVGDLSYYPTRGTIFRDGDAGAMDDRGLEVFMTLICSSRTTSSGSFQLTPSPADDRNA